MNDAEWLPWLAALAILGGGEKDAWPRLLRALMLGKVRSRGMLDDDPAAKPVVPHDEAPAPDAAPVIIPADLWAEWPFNPLKGWLIRPGHELRRIPVGFVGVRFFRPDIEALAREGEQAASPTPPQSASDAPAGRDVSAVEAGRAGGKKSGQSRRAGRKWVEHARALAEVACSRNTSASHARIAAAISDTWKLADVNCPGHETLSAFVSELRADGQLPERSASLPKRSGSGR